MAASIERSPEPQRYFQLNLPYVASDAALANSSLPLGLHGFEVEMPVALIFAIDRDADQVFALERALEKVLGERLRRVLFDGTTQTAGAEVLAGSFFKSGAPWLRERRVLGKAAGAGQKVGDLRRRIRFTAIST